MTKMINKQKQKHTKKRKKIKGENWTQYLKKHIKTRKCLMFQDCQSLATILNELGVILKLKKQF